MTKGTVSIRYSTRRLTDGYDVAAIGADGAVLAVLTRLVNHGYVLSQANQEHGIVSCESAPDLDIVESFPLGTRLRILPNHACATGAQFPEYRALSGDGQLAAWERFHGW